MKKTIVNVIFYGVCALLTLILLAQLGVLPFRMVYVSTGSMVPAFYPGDLAFVYVKPGINVKAGDVILFNTGTDQVLHRVKNIENGQITTQGDANNAPDLDKLNRAEGKLLFTLPKLGYAVSGLQSLFRPEATP